MDNFDGVGASLLLLIIKFIISVFMLFYAEINICHFFFAWLYNDLINL